MLEIYLSSIRPFKQLSHLFIAFCLMSFTFSFSQTNDEFKHKTTLNEKELLAFIKGDKVDQFNSKEDYIDYISSNTENLEDSKTLILRRNLFPFSRNTNP